MSNHVEHALLGQIHEAMEDHRQCDHHGAVAPLALAEVLAEHPHRDCCGGVPRPGCCAVYAPRPRQSMLPPLHEHREGEDLHCCNEQQRNCCV